MPKLDFSEVEEFIPVPVGRYIAEVMRSEQGMSASNQRKWSLMLQVREDSAHDGEFVDKTIKWDLSLQKKAMWKVMQTLQALGEDVSIDDTEFDFNPEDYVGRQVAMLVGTQTSEGYGTRTVVNRLAPVEEEAVAA